ncbi:MAG: hypothetical protein AAGC57_15075 [Pseudomonadota bacterium]
MTNIVAFPACLANQPLMSDRAAIGETEIARTRQMVAAFALLRDQVGFDADNVIDFTLYRWGGNTTVDRRGPAGAACRAEAVERGAVVEPIRVAV